MLDSTGTFSQPFRVRYEECGAAGTLCAAVHLRYLQELAFAHSAALGYPLTRYETERLFWLVRRIHLTVHAPARYGQDLLATTQVVGMRRVLARRHNTVRRERDGTLLATADVDWILTADCVAPTRIPDEMAARFPSQGEAIVSSPLQERQPPTSIATISLRIRTSDVDAMGHANHPVYLDFLEDAVTRTGGGAALAAHPRIYELQYHAAARAGAELRDVAWQDQGWWHYRLEDAGGVLDRKSTRLNSSHSRASRMPSSA